MGNRVADDLLLIVCSQSFAVLFGLHVTAFSLPLCVVVALMLLYWVSKRDGRAITKKRLLVIGVTYMVATVLLGYVVSWIWEYSYWGRGFYTDAVVKLADGWNPIYAGADGAPEIVYRSGKAVWMMDASFYAFLGHYEMAKLHTVMFAIPDFFIGATFLCAFVGRAYAFSDLVDAPVLANPVALSQMFTYYDDAVLAFLSVLFHFVLPYFK